MAAANLLSDDSIPRPYGNEGTLLYRETLVREGEQAEHTRPSRDDWVDD